AAGPGKDADLSGTATAAYIFLLSELAALAYGTHVGADAAVVFDAFGIALAGAEARCGLLFAEEFELVKERRGALVAGVYIGVHRLQRYARQFLGYVGVQLLGRDGAAGDMLERDLLRGVA